MCLRIIITVLLLSQLSSQLFATDKAELFIQSLIKNDNVDSFVDQSELKISDRLGIQYESVDNKYLISYDIEDVIKNSIRRDELDYTTETVNLEANYSKVILSIQELNYQKEFYFKDGKYISPISYYSRGWKEVESKHFRFLISDTTLFNSYCINNLENYFLKIARLLKFSEMRLKDIEAHKIYYILCKDEEEIELLTGFNIRGMYILAYDFVITTFNSHYHELMHLLMNFKLERLPLYTHPFFQEGFAVAFGGRGGKEPEVILNIGSFLYNSKMLDYSSLLSKKDFKQFDVSLSYPVSGLYNKFLIEQIGIEKYLGLYRKYSGTADEVGKMKIHENELPQRAAWEEFLADYSQKKAIDFKSSRIQAPLIYEGASVRVFEDSRSYYFHMRDTLLIGNDIKDKGYQSKKFHEFFKNRKYRGEKYLILANANEISIYNLFTNNLIANYVSSFSDTHSPVPSENGLYYFNVPKHIFDEKLKSILMNETD
jgi:hypothetical protein